MGCGKKELFLKIFCKCEIAFIILATLCTKDSSANLIHMKIKFLLSIVLGICVSHTYAANFTGTPIVSLKVKKIAADGIVDIVHQEISQEENLEDLRTSLEIDSEYQFFYHQTPLSNALTIGEHMMRFGPREEEGVDLIAIPLSQVDFSMQYFSMEKKYLRLTPMQGYTHASGARICLQIAGYTRRVEKELGASVAKEIMQLIALYTSIRCMPLHAPCIKKALRNPIQIKLLLTSAYKEKASSLIFDVLTPFVSENKPCDFLSTLPKKAIFFIYMYKDHFLDVKLLRWLTHTQRFPLRANDIAQANNPHYRLKKSCIDSLLADGDIPAPLLKRVIAEAKKINEWDVLISLAYHGFLDTNWDSNRMPYASCSEKKDSALSTSSHVILAESVQKIRRLPTYTYTGMLKGAVALGLIYLGVKYVAPKFSRRTD